MQGDLEAGKAVSFKVGDALTVQIEPGMVEIKQERKRVAGRSFTPSVIEPSFGIGRIIYCMFEHTFYNRCGRARQVQRRLYSWCCTLWHMCMGCTTAGGHVVLDGVLPGVLERGTPVTPVFACT